MQRIENSMILSNLCIAICNTDGMCGGLLGPKVRGLYFTLFREKPLEKKLLFLADFIKN